MFLMREMDFYKSTNGKATVMSFGESIPKVSGEMWQQVPNREHVRE